MAVKQTSDAEKSRPAVQKDDIISQIRQLEELRRETISAGNRAAATSSSAGSAAATRPGIDTRSYQPGQAAPRGSVFGPSVRTMATFCRQLATLVDSGIPLLRALQILAERSSDKRMRVVVTDLARRVEEGQPLSTAMNAYPGYFSGMFTGVVRAGEAAGILEDSLRRLADLLERRAEIRSRIRGALALPIASLVVEIIVIGIIVFYAMPKMLEAWPDPNSLPGITKALLGSVTWVTANWFLVAFLAAAAVAGIVLTLKLPAGRAAFQASVLRIPIIGTIVKKIHVARFSRTLGSLTAAGIPLLDGLEIAAETSDNIIVERVLLRTREVVERGGKMDQPLRSEPVFDEIVVDMVSIGDEAGALDTVLLKVADSYDAEVDSTLKGMASLLEPLLIVLLGVGVGFVAIATFLPYIKLVVSPMTQAQ